MRRADALVLALLFATAPAVAGEALDPDFLAYLADEAPQAASAKDDPELVAWIEDWWIPADDGRREEEPE